MVAVAVLAFGIVSIYEALFVSLDAFSYYSNYLETQTWANERLWEVQDKIMRRDIPRDEELAGEFSANNNRFQWEMVTVPIIEDRGLYDISLVLSWREGPRTIRVARHTHALALPEKKPIVPQ